MAERTHFRWIFPLLEFVFFAVISTSISIATLYHGYRVLATGH